MAHKSGHKISMTIPFGMNQTPSLLSLPFFLEDGYGLGMCPENKKA